MDARSKEQMARNEDVFRQINERIDLAALAHGRDHHRYEFFCECSDLNCVERVTATLEEYAYARADPARFLVVKGHALGEIEHVVGGARDHVFVEKDGAAGRAAVELDEQADAAES
ncbi:MAG: hypothetical protein ACRDM1_16555 [Gaiellaceae bacterium]